MGLGRRDSRGGGVGGGTRSAAAEVAVARGGGAAAATVTMEFAVDCGVATAPTSPPWGSGEEGREGAEAAGLNLDLDSFWQRARLLLRLLCQDGGGSMLGGIGSTIAQGMTFGTVSAMAHRVVDAVLGPRTIQHETVVSEAAAPAMDTDACSIHSKAFQDEHGETEEFFTSYDEVFESFDDMSLQENLLRGIYAYDLEKPSAIQQRGIVPFCKGLDVIQQAQFMRALGD
ncbi:unnamed protein product [Miscanthus lutarioriparius]|uniref:DEAD-box RNA helicase Q domain-containing protein n=1 Tax=Miscanthus lutarioriparius TaxID=422564 RepID=A0A811QS29_9POAL|nr:unnamed protein product [Miscanthus lutarioriparius]